MSFSAIDLFSGAGGLGSGLKLAGFNILASLETNSAAVKTHTINFPECKTIQGDITAISPKSFSYQSGVKKGEIDLIAGGPPCQTFSTIGRPKIKSLLSEKEEKNDPRNYLFKPFIDYVEYFKPRAFLMENVPGIKSKYRGTLFERLLELLDGLDYDIHVSVLNAADFGVPQIRKRLFIVGTEKGRNFSFPKAMFFDPNNRQNELFSNSHQSAYRTLENALSDLPKIFDGCRLGLLDYSNKAQCDFQRKVRSATGKVGNNVCRISNERAKRVFEHMKQGEKYSDLAPEIRQILPFREDIFKDRLKRLVLKKPAWTVLAHIGMDGYMYIHPTETRTLSVREAARIQSFRDDFEFFGNMREQYVQVGNAVPPILAESLGNAIIECLN